MSGLVVAWVDRMYDREMASDGTSRYGAYLRQKADWFADVWRPGGLTDDPVLFAVAAWSVGTSPVMTPGLVMFHPRVLAARAERHEDGGHLLVTVEVVSQRPAVLAGVLGGRWLGWQRSADGERWREPDPGSPPWPVALPVLTLIVPVPAADLPAPAAARRRGSGGPVPELAAAFAAVDAVVEVLNRVVSPVLAALDGGGRR